MTALGKIGLDTYRHGFELGGSREAERVVELAGSLGPPEILLAPDMDLLYLPNSMADLKLETDVEAWNRPVNGLLIQSPELARGGIVYAANVVGPGKISCNPDCGGRTRAGQVYHKNLTSLVKGVGLAGVIIGN